MKTGKVQDVSQKTCQRKFFNQGLSGEKPDWHSGLNACRLVSLSTHLNAHQSVIMKQVLLMLMAGLSLQSSAQTDTTKLLDEVVVTANRFVQKQNQTGKVMTVISRAVLEKNTGRNLGEILGQYVGLTIAGANNNRGTNLDVYTRGAGLGNTLILIDGTPVYDAASISSAFDLNYISPEMIERVEILKGGQSTIYGSDAVAGVINIILRKPSTGKPTINALLGTGSFGTIQAQAGLSGTKGKTGYRVQYDLNKSDGISTALDTTKNKNFDKDGFRQHQLSAGIQTALTDKLTFNLNGVFSTYKTELDASGFKDDADNTVDNRQLLVSTGLTYDLSKTKITANYSFNSSKRYYLDDSLSRGSFAKFSESDFLSMAHFAEIYGKTKVSERFSLVYGTDIRLQSTTQSYLSISSYGPYTTELSGDSAKTSLYSVFASGVWNHEKGWNIEGGLRLNNHSRYGSNVTYTFNPSYVAGNWKYFVNISSAFKAPTLYQLYDGFSGYAGLKPEYSQSYEAGAQVYMMQKSLLTRVVLFQRNLRDGIDYSYVSNKYFNNNKVVDKGLELEVLYKKGKWNVNANYTYLKGEVNTKVYRFNSQTYTYSVKGDTTYNYQFRRPAHLINVNVGYQIHSKWYVGLQGRYVGNRQEAQYMAAPIALKAYFLASANIDWRASSKATVYLNVNNLFNARFVDIWGFGTKPVNLMAGVRVRL